MEKLNIPYHTEEEVKLFLAGVKALKRKEYELGNKLMKQVDTSQKRRFVEELSRLGDFELIAELIP